MDQLRKIIISLLPSRVLSLLRTVHRDLVFRRAMKRFLKYPEICKHPDNNLVDDLIYGWGNEGWSVEEEYLAECVNHALNSHGTILECGSGLSTILIGAIAKQTGQGYWALEHDPKWAARVQKFLKRYKLGSVFLCTTHLKDYGEFCWYSVPLEIMPDGFSLVICDGPPGSTKGGRYGLIPIMRERLNPGCVILLDDADREPELTIGRRWEIELDSAIEILGSKKNYIKMTVMDSDLPTVNTDIT
jgi:predicted O-methyltransferase YrrM